MLYAVFGNPIEHSRSPTIHQLFAHQEKVDLIYEKRLVTHTLAQALHDFENDGGLGANVTVPCKTEAFKLSSQLSERARMAGAVNTLFRLPENQGWYGDNTDGIGLVRDIQRLGVSLHDARILLLGAGGAARGIIYPLKEAGAHISIANRTFSKAQELSDWFNIQAIEFSDITPSFDMIINSTSASLNQQTLPIDNQVFANAVLAYDLVYGDTAFIQQAKQAKTSLCVDGLGMLVAQAAASYALWRGFEPDIEPVLETLKKS